jgi:NADPH:quinone reductase-like Zn-dependent oxidoreductase
VQFTTEMKALYFERYGNSEVLSLREVPGPELTPGQVLINVQCASVNPLDWRLMRADPFLVRMSSGLFKPKMNGLGAYFSGVVESTAADVSGFKPGDAVFGLMPFETIAVGSFAETISVSADALVRKPASLSHQQASTLGVAALTAYEGIHDYRPIKPGDDVLINGASGGIGTFAVQMAKALGAHVTAVCSGRNAELVRGIGADEVIDYQSINLLGINERYHLIFDTIGNHPPKKLKQLLAEDGRLVLASAASGLGFLKAMAIAGKEHEPVDLIVTLKKDRERLEAVLALFVEGKIKPVIDREYPFSEIAAAIDYVATKRARGKVVVNIAE